MPRLSGDPLSPRGDGQLARLPSLRPPLQDLGRSPSENDFRQRPLQEVFRQDPFLRPLGFVDSKPYTERLKVYNKKFNGSDAVVVGQGEICKIPTLVAAMEYGFMGGSMGSAVGEKLARSIDRCLDRRLPLVIVSCSGGARMQEGILSLMQLAKVSTGLARMRAKALPFISVLTDPTTGGVTASYAMLVISTLPNPALSSVSLVHE